MPFPGAPHTRQDLFISYHGVELLSSGLRVRDIVEKAVGHITDMGFNFGAKPSIFFDKDPENLSGPVQSTIFNSLLRTRGGGLGLCLITKNYFRKSYCLTEMRALREMCEQDNQMRMRYICIGCSADDILNDQFVKNVDPEIGENQLLDKIAPDGNPIARGRRLNFDTLEAAAQDIAEIVWRAWRRGRGASSNAHGSGDVLGATIETSFERLSKIFGPGDRTTLIYAFGMSVVTAPPDILGVLNAALNEYHQLSYYDISMLRTAISGNPTANTRRQMQAVDAYERKWIWTNSLSWDYTFIEDIFSRATEQLRDVQEVV